MLVNNVYQLEAIQDTKLIAQDNNTTITGSKAMIEELSSTKADANYYGNLSGGYAQGTGISALVTKDWNPSDGITLGFNPIGSEANPFTGSFSGNGGSNGYGIYDLSIQRANENNVGLFARTSDAYIGAVSVIDSKILGGENVGGIAGYAASTEFSGDTTRKRYSTADGPGTTTTNTYNVKGTTDVGGLVGEMTSSTIRWSTNASQVEGTANTGGLVGNLQGGRKGGSGDYQYSITQSQNLGYESSSEDVKQGYGVIKGTTKTGGLVGSMTDGSITESHSNGQVSGKDQTGGLIGEMDKGTLSGSYNTNEATTLGTIDNDAAVGGGTSIYGKVTGKVTGTGTGTDTGGLIGKMTAAEGTNTTKVDTAYNAGNVSGVTNVGGMIGTMTGGTVTHAYNGDNNTVIYAQSGVENAAYVGFKVKNGTTYDAYTYNSSTQMWKKNSDATEIATDKLPSYASRIYNNRLAYRDATVNGTTNVGGLVGTISGSSSLSQTYNAGKITGTENVGAAIGNASSTASVADSFYITTNQDGTANLSTANLSTAKAIGKGSLANTSMLTEKTLYEAENVATITNGVNWTGTENQDTNWMVYSNSAAPLLKHFMKSIDINRQYEYDGTTHNLITADIANDYHYYGGAFFTDGKGQNVYTSDISVVTNYKASDWTIKTGSANSDTTHSSLYHYDQANMWSPQHGYYTKGTAAVIITPEPVKVTATATKTYGQLTKGYVYYDGSSKYYTYTADNQWITTTKPADGTAYIVTVSALAKSENPLTVLANLNTLSVKNNGSGITDFANKASDTDNQKTNASSTAYTLDMSSSTVQGAADNTKYNYAVSYDGKLTVNKADLYFTATGTRLYGNDNATTTITSITAVTKNDSGTNDDTADTGALKSWDATTSLTNLSGYGAASGVSNYTLISTEPAKNGAKTTSPTINKGTWVKDSAANPGAYTLDTGSFKNADGTSQLTSNNYNLIYVGNKVNAAAADKTGTYTITPLSTSYTVTTTSEYGTGIRKAETATFDNISGADAQQKLLDDLAKTYELSKKHVTAKTDQDGNVLYNEDGTIQTNSVTIDSTTQGELKDNPNYLLIGGHYTYTITPASVTYKADDDTWTAGMTSPVNPLSGRFLDARNGDSIETDGIGLSTTITSASPVGTYLDSIFSKGPSHAGSAGHLYDYYVTYRPGTMVVNAAVDPVYDAAIHGIMPGNKASQDITNQLSGKDGAGMTVQAGDAAGGYIPREARDGIRFITIEDTGLNLEVAAAANNTITIDAGSRADGGASVSITGSGEARSLAGTATAEEVQQQMQIDEKLAQSHDLTSAQQAGSLTDTGLSITASGTNALTTTSGTAAMYKGTPLESGAAARPSETTTLQSDAPEILQSSLRPQPKSAELAPSSVSNALKNTPAGQTKASPAAAAAATETIAVKAGTATATSSENGTTASTQPAEATAVDAGTTTAAATENDENADTQNGEREKEKREQQNT